MPVVSFREALNQAMDEEMMPLTGTEGPSEAMNREVSKSGMRIVRNSADGERPGDRDGVMRRPHN